MENVGNVISPLSSEEEEGEEDEESSSSPAGLEMQLSSFRQQWEAELSTKKEANGNKGERKNRRRTISSSSLGDGSSTAEDKAYCLFMQGVDAERDGQMFEAIKYYRQAVQLVPDIESKIQSISGFDDYSSEVSEESADEAEEHDEDEVEDVAAQLEALTISNIRYTCQRQFYQKGQHISCLPIELLILVFRWVVASHLDLRSLENLATVCRGFYACARDQEIWRLVCQRIWGSGACLLKDYPSWRQMYLERAHLRYDGVYICRMTYVRQGEQSYIDASYNTWFLVEYYRFIRVFPDGSIIMLTSPGEPKEVVSSVRLKSATGEGIVKGHYRLVGNMLSAVLERVREETPYQRYKRKTDRNNNPSRIKSQIFRLEMEVSGTGRCNNTKLGWKHYSCETTYSSSGAPSVSEFDISSFRPLFFSRVKSYTRTAVCPL